MSLRYKIKRSIDPKPSFLLLRNNLPFFDIKFQHSKYNIEQNLSLSLITFGPTFHITHKNILHILSVNIITITCKITFMFEIFLVLIVIFGDAWYTLFFLYCGWLDMLEVVIMMLFFVGLAVWLCSIFTEFFNLLVFLLDYSFQFINSCFRAL